MDEQNESRPDEETTDERALALTDESIDIDAALASVSSLSDAIAEQEAQEAAEQARIDEERQRVEAEAAERAAYVFPRPPMLRLQRGQLTSVIPALVLIIAGAALTFALSAPDTTIDGPIVLLAAAGVLGVTMLAQWLTSGRWAGGALFGGLSLLVTVGVILFMVSSEDFSAWPLLLSGIGVAAVASALLSQPLSRYQWFLGVGLIIGGAAGYAITADLLGDATDTLVPILGAIVLVAAVLIAIAPIVARRRG
jgi:hypothetical protein